MFEGPRVFFIVLMWLGWLSAALGFFSAATNLNPGQEFAYDRGLYLVSMGIAIAAFSMVGRMIASIGKCVEAISEDLKRKGE